METKQHQQQPQRERNVRIFFFLMLWLSLRIAVVGFAFDFILRFVCRGSVSFPLSCFSQSMLFGWLHLTHVVFVIYVSCTIVQCPFRSYKIWVATGRLGFLLSFSYSKRRRELDTYTNVCTSKSRKRVWHKWRLLLGLHVCGCGGSGVGRKRRKEVGGCGKPLEIAWKCGNMVVLAGLNLC